MKCAHYLGVLVIALLFAACGGSGGDKSQLDTSNDVSPADGLSSPDGGFDLAAPDGADLSVDDANVGGPCPGARP